MERPTHAGLRHLALNVHDFDAMRHFYVDLLGFVVEWEPDGDTFYLSSGIENLAAHRLDTSSRSTDQRNAMLQPSDSSLDHLGLIVRTADDVDRWAAFLESQGIEIAAAPRTPRDGARSCYVRAPGGNS